MEKETFLPKRQCKTIVISINVVSTPCLLSSAPLVMRKWKVPDVSSSRRRSEQFSPAKIVAFEAFWQRDYCIGFARKLSLSSSRSSSGRLYNLGTYSSSWGRVSSGSVLLYSESNLAEGRPIRASPDRKCNSHLSKKIFDLKSVYFFGRNCIEAGLSRLELVDEEKQAISSWSLLAPFQPDIVNSTWRLASLNGYTSLAWSHQTQLVIWSSRRQLCGEN